MIKIENKYDLMLNALECIESEKFYVEKKKTQINILYGKIKKALNNKHLFENLEKKHDDFVIKQKKINTLCLLNIKRYSNSQYEDIIEEHNKFLN